MKHIISILLFLFCLQLYIFARTQKTFDNQLVTQIRVVDNDSMFLYLYVYDSGNKVLETKFYQPDTTTFIRKSLTEWIYNDNKCITQRERIWGENGWNFSYIIEYGYSGNVLQSETHSTYSNGIAQAIKQLTYEYANEQIRSKKEYARLNDLWHLNLQTDYRYLSDNKQDSLIITQYKADTVNSRIISRFHYNGAGLLASQLQKQYKNSTWQNTDSINWFYYSNSALVQTQKNKVWNGSLSTWENSQRVDYTYDDNNKLTSESYQHWKTMFWENDIRYDYQYNESNLLKKSLSLPVYEDWRKILSVNYSDFTQNKSNTIKSVYEFWGGNSGELTTSFIPFMFNDEIAIKRARSIKLGYTQYNDTLLSNPVYENLNRVHAYPNPSNGIFYLNYQQSGIQSWSVTDLNGRTLKVNESAVQSGVIDLTELPRGIYLLRIISSDGLSFQKLIKQ